MGQGARVRSRWWKGRVPHLWWRQVYACMIILTVLSASGVQCCGPGRGGARRRAPRKMTPLVFKEHVPYVSENTLGASGLIEGAIDRNDPRLNDLVPNYNSDIIFKDDEGTGADRIMTERLEEKLDTLSISVMNQWPGLKLRVIEGWDEDGTHGPDSLHYEGRAVDITTSDKDRMKLGMLARLAVEVGFDWVYYKSRNYIHCSVKAGSSAASRLGGCFPGSSHVLTPNGRLAVSRLQKGDEVQVMRQDGTLTYSPVLMFLHRDPAHHRMFLQLITASGTSLTLTPSHLVFMMRPQVMRKAPVMEDMSNPTMEVGTPTLEDALEAGMVVVAARVEVGDYLLVTGQHGDPSELRLEKVLSVKQVAGSGVFAPLTAEGTVVVDGVVASCYAVIDSQAAAHWAFLPVRLYNNLKEAALTLLRSLVTITSPSSPDKPLKSESIGEAINNTSQSNVRWRADIMDNEVETENTTTDIHWYPRLLYTLAYWLLPSHLVYS